MKKTTAKKFSWWLRVYYEDTDAGQVVYYANYLKYFERARTEFLRAHDFNQNIMAREHDVIFVVRKVEVEYIKPACLDDELQVVSEIEKLTGTRFFFKQTIIDIKNNLLCTAIVQVACLKQSSFKPQAIPEFIIKKLKS